MLAIADCVCLDVDSTASLDEGLDLAAEYLGVGEVVGRLTNQGMDGQLSFAESLRARLSLLRPKSSGFFSGGTLPVIPRPSPGAAEFVDLLHRRGVAVFLISGGFEPFVFPIARSLGIDTERVFANAFEILADGSIGDLDTMRPTTRDDGKRAVLQLLRTRGFQRIVMVGDGVSDLAAAPAASAFVGYGGVVVRERVRAAADWFVRSFAELAAVLSDAQ
jgi:phosphoserine phosphatase